MARRRDEKGKEGLKKLKTRGWGDNTYDGIEWIIVQGKWIGRERTKYNHIRGEKGDYVKKNLLINISKGLVLLSIVILAIRIVVALLKDTAPDDLRNKVDIGEMAYNVDELVSENGISDDSASKAGDLIDDEAESETDRKRRNRKIRTPYGDSDDVKDEEWIDWY